jgi:hypothetical protein
MKTIETILREKVAGRRKTMKIFGQEIYTGPDPKPVRERLANDPALKWLAQSISEAMINIAAEYTSYGGPVQSPFKVAEALEVAFAETIMLWEEVNEEWNAQLAKPEPKVQINPNAVRAQALIYVADILRQHYVSDQNGNEYLATRSILDHLAQRFDGEASQLMQ